VDEDRTGHWKYTGLLVESDEYPEHGSEEIRCPYGVPGDRLWVRETFSPHPEFPGYIYRADRGGDYQGAAQGDFTWKPSIHMPRAASRITLEITDIRVERVKDISEADAIAEGCSPHVEPKWWQGYHCDDPSLHQVVQSDENGNPPDWLIEPKPYRDLSHLNRSAKTEYQNLWDSLNKSRGFGWDANPFVWVIQFRRLT
jgi:hypothetical protein